MFGFLSTPCGRCAGESLPVWRGVFCGLARCLAREYGAPARLLVNRDAAFLGLLGLSLAPREPQWKHATCCNPMSRPFPVADTHPAIAHAAAATVCGLAAKLADDAHDERGPRRGLARLGLWATTPAVDNAIAFLNSSGFPTLHVLETLSTQSRIETQDPALAERPTATAYGEITAHLAVMAGVPSLRENLCRTGSALGALVYWRDAWQDRETDIRRGRFNPFACLNADELRARISRTWQEFSEALATLPSPRHGHVLEEIRRATEKKRGLFLQTTGTNPSPTEQPKERKRREKKDSTNCCIDCCCECRGWHNCCDCACDTGARDSGCIDCGTCDCNCCSCN